MDKRIASDLYRYEGLTGVTGLLKGLRIPGFRYLYLIRKAANCKKYSLGWIFYTRLIHRYSFKYGFQIPIHTEIGAGFYIGHFGPIVINEKAIIGENCNIAHNVTIGQTNRGKQSGCPTLGDQIWIGTGSVIVGSIKIGSNVLIAPNSFVNVDVPEHSLVIGNPCKIIRKENPCEGYIGSIPGVLINGNDEDKKLKK